MRQLAHDLMVELAALETDDCVVWPRWIDRDGYGQVSTATTTIKVHRFALAARTPPPSPRHHAAHGPCHNAACMNYRHLSWKTSSQNQMDRHRDGTMNQGETHGRARLTEADVIDARRRWKAGQSIGSLAREFDVVAGTMANAVKGATWKHLPLAA